VRSTQIDVPHARVAGDFLGRALDQQPPADHHDDAVGEAKDGVHVVLDEQHCDVARQSGDHLEQLGALPLRHAGRGLVEQQHLRPGGERERDLEEPLLAIGELAGRSMAVRSELQREQDRMRLLDRIPIGRQLPPPGSGAAAPFAHRQGDRLERTQMGKQRVDLERAHQAALDASFGTERRDLLAAEKNLSAVGFEHAGDQIDQRGLAGAVGTDQGVACAERQIELHLLHDRERAETFVQAAGRQRRRAHARPPAGSNRANPPRMPLGKNITTATSSAPIQKYQYCGLIPEN
jgi:hypothetical protein